MTAGEPLMVLIGDEDAMSRAIVQRMVEKLGHRTLLAGSGAELLDTLDHHVAASGIDVVVLNLDMVDGADTARRLLARERRPRLVVVTGGEESQVGDACLERPVRLDALGAVLAPPRVAPAVDLDVLSSIRDAWTDGHASLVALVDSFFADVDRQLPQMRAALEAGELEKARRFAHAMKGSTGSIGASRLAERFRAIDFALRAGDGARARALLPEVAAERDLARQVFTAELAKP